MGGCPGLSVVEPIADDVVPGVVAEVNPVDPSVVAPAEVCALSHVSVCTNVYEWFHS